MLSILIPTYNYNVYPLASELEKQALDANIEFEIICFDDGSKSDINNENNKINKLQHSKFLENKKNVGLSNNRNLLAEASKFENLLFIDGDSILPNSYFIMNYVEALKSNNQVIYGGRIHPEKAEVNRTLRWKYGKYIEDQTDLNRKKNIYKSVLFNNTLIKKTLFNKIKFEENIIQYGHEDTVFAYKISVIKTSVLHIDNPVLHGDIDLNEVYLKKTEKALENLNFIYKNNLIDYKFITFLKLFKKTEKIKLNYLLSLFYKLFNKFLTHNLTSKNPSLFVFNLFRISYFSYINLKK
ncbi:glycosyltransferase family 2 protein [Siansivirga zeaxanthinifaciens]|uniref:Glycosyltransferase 2-like domain-containing protein n=1 Tax=Siansivirga zeaxanthinifaciens CC-SAMT-1 TaxID=1454006 RepID=A0A0C5WCD4_9FLAO|nr:glycosyltransferase [Siansivirga zeaxanthinifaciens]AJR04703.1 hypothetical protein AW14_00770 [Siansivirga zeaxanthinifaciens CC-SAMT-1]